MNSPTIPGMNISGAKATRVVRLDVNTGTATSPTPTRAASQRGRPALTWR